MYIFNLKNRNDNCIGIFFNKMTYFNIQIVSFRGQKIKLRNPILITNTPTSLMKKQDHLVLHFKSNYTNIIYLLVFFGQIGSISPIFEVVQNDFLLSCNIGLTSSK